MSDLGHYQSAWWNGQQKPADAGFSICKFHAIIAEIHHEVIMALSAYTTAASVRAVLGVATKELPDTVIANVVFYANLLAELDAISSTLAADYLTVKAIVSPTASQERFALLGETFCAYVVALQCTPQLAASSPMTIKDSKSEATRIADFTKGLRDNITASIVIFRRRLSAAYAALYPAYTAPIAVTEVNIVNVGLGVDPVTG